ncbi:hypothetical protein LUZ60_010775 [Juncus effusus]|nr:hypothetical protein LUZ60_010775 [Juncus effusus]
MGQCCSTGTTREALPTLPELPPPAQQVTPTVDPVVPSDSILNKPYDEISKYYTLGRELGHGLFGATYLCTGNSMGQQFVCKTTVKKKLENNADREDVKREIQIMQHLSGQPNIIEFKRSFEDEDNVHVVMEYCAGGELFDRIIAKGHYSEKEASTMCRAMLNVVYNCHFMGVMHRDLKPENFLLTTNNENAMIKATDFGLSVFIEEGKVYRDIVGSAFYLAPEVLRRNYGKEIDIWSVGVILYVLLSGAPPFWAETEKGIFDAILRGKIDFESDPWPSISDNAKDLVKKMLTQDPKKRITSAEALRTEMNKLKKMTLKVIAKNLNKEEIKGLKQLFFNMDEDRSGTITYDELKAGLAKLGSKLSEDEVKQLMEAADLDGNGSLDYMEFITATMHRHKLKRDRLLYKAFLHFDKDNSGYITRDELKAALIEHEMYDPGAIDEILVEIDTNNDGRINYEEFVAMMRDGLQKIMKHKK